jgi:hypothetical protein
MKRSTKVTLVLMTVAGVSAGAYAMAQNSDCSQSGENAAPGDAQQSCRTPHGGGHGFIGPGGPGGAGTPPAAGSGESSAGGAASRGGFGGTGHGMAGGE